MESISYVFINKFSSGIGIGSSISPEEILLAPFPIKKSGCEINLDTKITDIVINIRMMILINMIRSLALRILVSNEYIEAEVLIIYGWPLKFVKTATYNIS